MFGLKTPDVTLAQILAGVGWIVTQAVAMGVVDNTRGQLVLQIASTGITAAWVIADSIIRNGRAKGASAVEVAKINNAPAGGTSAD